MVFSRLLWNCVVAGHQIEESGVSVLFNAQGDRDRRMLLALRPDADARGQNVKACDGLYLYRKTPFSSSKMFVCFVEMCGNKSASKAVEQLEETIKNVLPPLKSNQLIQNSILRAIIVYGSGSCPVDIDKARDRFLKSYGVVLEAKSCKRLDLAEHFKKQIA